MKLKNFKFLIIIIELVVLIGLSGYRLYKYINENKDELTKNETSKEDNNILLKELTFLEDADILSLQFYDEKYILTNNTLYDLDGNIILDGNNENYEIDEYINDYILVKKDGKYGVLNLNVEIIIPIQYSRIKIISDNCFYLETISDDYRVSTKIYNPKSKKEYGPYFTSNYYSDEIIIVEKFIGKETDIKDGWVNSNLLKTYILNLVDDSLIESKTFSDYHFYDISFFEDEKIFQEKYIVASKLANIGGFKQGLIDINNQKIIPFKYDNITNIENKYLLLELNSNFELVKIENEEVKTILSFETGEYESFDIFIENDVIVIEKNFSEEYYDKNGNLIYERSNLGNYYMSSISYINDDKYILDLYGEDDDQCLYIDLSDNKIMKKEIDYSYCYKRSASGYIARMTEHGVTLYNNKLEQIGKNYYNNVSLMDNYFVIKTENDKYKILTYDEKEVIDQEFDGYEYIDDNELLLEIFPYPYKKYYLK